MTQSKTASSAANSTDVSPPAPLTGLSLLARLAGLAVFVGAVLLSIVYYVPDGNNYSLAMIDKHARLARTDRPKIVFVGGSNLAYGIDSAMVEQATGRNVVNMGMNGYLGVRFMLEEIQPSLQAGDLVVIAFEYDNYYKSVEGTGHDLLMIVKTRPAGLADLNAGQLFDIASMVPLAAQQKVLRILKETFRSVKGEEIVLRAEMPPDELVSGVESYEGFNEYGDLVSHLPFEWVHSEREQGIDLTTLGIDDEVVGLIKSYATRMEAKDVKVVVSFCSVMRSFYEQHKETINDVHRRLQAENLEVPLAPEDFVFTEDLFFDTVYHLGQKGRQIRTRRVLESIQPYLAQP